MSASPMNDLSVLLDGVYYPILNNPANQEGWPEVIKKDIDLHIQDLRNVIAEVSIMQSNACYQIGESKSAVGSIKRHFSARDYYTF